MSFYFQRRCRPEMMECNEGRSLQSQARKGRTDLLSNAGGKCPRLLSTYLSPSTFVTTLFTFVRRDGRAAGTFMNTGPAKPLRLKVRLVQVWNVGIKNGLVGTLTPHHWLGATSLNKPSCSQPGQVENCETAERRVEIKIGIHQSGLLLSKVLLLPRSSLQGYVEMR
jgi:hypothetical protein